MPIPDLTTREISVLFWTAIFITWGLSHRSVGGSVKDLVRAALVRPVLTFFLFLAIWTVVSTWLLGMVGLWTPGQLKETILWVLFTAVAAGVDAATGYDDPDYRKAVLEGIGIFVIVGFVVESHPFSLPIELILVPTLGFVAVMHGVAEGMGTHPEVKRLLEVLLAVAGFSIAGAAAVGAWHDFADLASLDSARSLMVPPLLSLLFLPALFVIVLQARYEWLFGKLQGGWRYRTYARARLALLLGPRPRMVLEFGRKHAFELPHVRTARELDALLAASRSGGIQRKSLGESA